MWITLKEPWALSMIGIDTNILVYAHRGIMEPGRRARERAACPRGRAS